MIKKFKIDLEFLENIEEEDKFSQISNSRLAKIKFLFYIQHPKLNF